MTEPDSATDTDTDTDTTLAATPAASVSSAPSATEVFRAHATARLRGDTAEAARIAAAFTGEERRQHMLFVQALFAGVVIDSLGSAPDPFDLAQLTKRLHDKHFRPESGEAAFIALRAEAMIRSLFGEEFLLFEIPYSEQPGYMWAIMTELSGPDPTDEELAERFRLAEEIARDGFAGAAESIAAMFAEPKSDNQTEAETEPESDTESVGEETK